MLRSGEQLRLQCREQTGLHLKELHLHAAESNAATSSMLLKRRSTTIYMRMVGLNHKNCCMNSIGKTGDGVFPEETEFLAALFVHSLP